MTPAEMKEELEKLTQELYRLQQETVDNSTPSGHRAIALRNLLLRGTTLLRAMLLLTKSLSEYHAHTHHRPEDVNELMAQKQLVSGLAQEFKSWIDRFLFVYRRVSGQENEAIRLSFGFSRSNHDRPSSSSSTSPSSSSPSSSSSSSYSPSSSSSSSSSPSSSTSSPSSSSTIASTTLTFNAESQEFNEEKHHEGKGKGNQDAERESAKEGDGLAEKPGVEEEVLPPLAMRLLKDNADSLVAVEASLRNASASLTRAISSLREAEHQHQQPVRRSVVGSKPSSASSASSSSSSHHSHSHAHSHSHSHRHFDGDLELGDPFEGSSFDHSKILYAIVVFIVFFAFAEFLWR